MKILEQLKAILLSPRLYLSVLTVVAAVLLWSFSRRAIRGIRTKSGMDTRKAGHLNFAGSILKYLIALLAVVIILQINGVNVSSLVTGLGVVGIIVGFALQDLLSDIIAGTNILWDGYYQVGDMVHYGTIEEGRVVSFSLKSTRIYDVNTGTVTTVANRNVSEIEKLSDWLDMVVPAPYEIPAERMRRVCRDIAARAEALEGVTGAEFLGTNEFGDSAIFYKLRVHCPMDKKGPTRRAVNGLIQDVFAEEHIDVPYNQLDVHMKGDA